MDKFLACLGIAAQTNLMQRRYINVPSLYRLWPLTGGPDVACRF